MRAESLSKTKVRIHYALSRPHFVGFHYFTVFVVVVVPMSLLARKPSFGKFHFFVNFVCLYIVESKENELV